MVAKQIVCGRRLLHRLLSMGRPANFQPALTRRYLHADSLSAANAGKLMSGPLWSQAVPARTIARRTESVLAGLWG
jgi:hypothetical protein